MSLDVDTVAMHNVIAQFGDHRLLSFDSDRLTGSPTVEVAHEALLTAWPILEGWVDEGRDDLRRHAALAMAQREWQLADHKPTYLLPSARLAEYDQWSRTSGMALNLAERQFLEASTAHVEAERESIERRRQQEARSRRRLWALVGALAGTLAVVALFLFGVLGDGDDPTVTFFGDRDDEGFNANIGSGLDRADRELDMQLVDVAWVVDPASEFRTLAESGPRDRRHRRAGGVTRPRHLRGLPGDPVRCRRRVRLGTERHVGRFRQQRKAPSWQVRRRR